MPEITLSNETVQYINMASAVSNAHIIDCVVDEERIVFVVEKGQIGIAIGAKAKNLERLRMLLKKNVKFVEYDSDKKTFIINLCKPYKVKSVTIDDNNESSVARIHVESSDKSKLIGKNGKNISMIRTVAQRHHCIRDVQIT
ncbi:MAG: NusA-like transcription termination signal-binding factor [Euryarchaeota archaeon]|nr:NusA-like transcription termination signal-binding factor [Euryarchaeota archaeon]